MVREELKESLQVSENSELNRKLILINDNVNTFDHVIDSLIDVCEHTEEQAEQCTLIAHFKGKCAISSGKIDKLKAYKRMLSEKKIKSMIH